MIAISYSGGKDSNAMLIKAIEDGLEFRATYQDTGFEHSSHYDYIRYIEKALGIEIEFVKSKDFDGLLDLIEKRNFMPHPLRRACTDYLKQIPFKDWLVDNPDISEVWLGMRTQESAGRAKRYGGLSTNDVFPLSDFPKFGKRKFGHIMCRLPIVDWTTEEVWEAHKRQGLKRNPQYEAGATRVGCYPCLLGTDKAFWLAWQTEEGRNNIKELARLERKINKHRGNDWFEGDESTRPLTFRRNYETIDDLILSFREKESQVDMFDDSADLACSWCQG